MAKISSKYLLQLHKYNSGIGKIFSFGEIIKVFVNSGPRSDPIATPSH